jgi:hypothetical protein
MVWIRPGTSAGLYIRAGNGVWTMAGTHIDTSIPPEHPARRVEVATSVPSARCGHLAARVHHGSTAGPAPVAAHGVCWCPGMHRGGSLRGVHPRAVVGRLGPGAPVHV